MEIGDSYIPATCPFLAISVRRIPLHTQIGDAVAQLGVLVGEGVGVNLIEQTTVEQLGLMLAQQIHITLKMADVFTRSLLLFRGPFRIWPVNQSFTVSRCFILANAPAPIFCSVNRTS